jgi:beta-lactam-binding protein with PASTA domain
VGTVYQELKDIDLEGSASNIYGDGGWSNDDDAVVVSFKPNAGTKVERYGTVTITFATKKELAFYKRPMPNLKGKQWEDLSATNPDLYLHFEVKYRDARDSETPGAVVEQRPA